MLMPSRTKYRKVRKGRIHGNTATSLTRLSYGQYGLV
ncbi:MAG TPA: 50S ribosomal protein L16, partial [Candidatus Binatia bacterium]|nr:50S ribosomal protein L16 [Candidatus Binatia bacterium]